MKTNMVYRIFTATGGNVSETRVENYKLANGKIIPAITVGETGCGGEMGIIPVSVPVKKNEKDYDPLVTVQIGETRTGRPRFIPSNTNNISSEKCIIVFRTGIGFRGCNLHTGKYLGWMCSKCKNILYTGFYRPHEGEEGYTSFKKCEKCGTLHDRLSPNAKRCFEPFPGEILVKGITAQGAAGSMGAGEQMVAILPKNTIIITSYYGRLYGRPPAHVWWFDGATLKCCSIDEYELGIIEDVPL